MKVATIFTVLLVLVSYHNGNTKEICPKMCTCDIYEGLKRADCSDQNLASPVTNVARSVEILNLAGNEITTVDEDCFEGYSDLIKLSLSRNSIHTIELFAFEALVKLNFLDLSDNRLEVLDNRMLENNEKLTVLDLSKNKFMLIEDKLPLIISRSLEFLSLSNSHLSHVYESIFSELPKLVDLDISNNLLITLMPSSFEPLDNLQYINLEYNRFSCDLRIENTLRMFKEKNVNVKIDKCVKNSKKPMFEKMIMSPDYTTASPEREDIEIELVWSPTRIHVENDFDSDSDHENAMPVSFTDFYNKIKHEDDIIQEFNCENEGLFESTCECHRNFVQFYEKVESSRTIYEKLVQTRIVVIFVLGSFVGFFCGCMVVLVCSWIRKKCAAINQKQVERQKARDRLLLNNARLIMTSPQNSPLPAVRNRITVPMARSPVPTPRNVQNSIIEPSSIQRESFSSRTESPSIRRRTEIQPRTSATQSTLSPTANLIHKLFRNRDPGFLPNSSELTPLTPRRSPITSAVPELRITEENVYSEAPSAPSSITNFPNFNGRSSQDSSRGSSEYLSIDNLSLYLDLDNMRNDSVTPPPPYRSIFDEIK